MSKDRTRRLDKYELLLILIYVRFLAKKITKTLSLQSRKKRLVHFASALNF